MKFMFEIALVLKFKIKAEMGTNVAGNRKQTQRAIT